MALTPEKIDVLYMRNGLGKFHQPVDSLQCEYEHCILDFARAIEAEVRKQDDALILQLVEAFEYVRNTPTYQYDAKTGHRLAKEALQAGRARLEGKP